MLQIMQAYIGRKKDIESLHVGWLIWKNFVKKKKKDM